MSELQQLYPDMHDLYKQREGMVSYLKLKLSQEDWHGVADAAMDIREIEAKLQLLKSILRDP
jgi:hypothetical protein